MAFNEALGARIREALAGQKDITERKMFGGLCFMLHGNMVGGVLKDEMVVKIGKEAHEKVAGKKHVRPFDFTGKPMVGIVYVGQAALKTRKDLDKWLALGIAQAKAKPPKKAKSKLGRQAKA